MIQMFTIFIQNGKDDSVPGYECFSVNALGELAIPRIGEGVSFYSNHSGVNGKVGHLERHIIGRVLDVEIHYSRQIVEGALVSFSTSVTVTVEPDERKTGVDGAK